MAVFLLFLYSEAAESWPLALDCILVDDSSKPARLDNIANAKETKLD